MASAALGDIASSSSSTSPTPEAPEAPSFERFFGSFSTESSNVLPARSTSFSGSGAWVTGGAVCPAASGTVRASLRCSVLELAPARSAIAASSNARCSSSRPACNDSARADVWTAQTSANSAIQTRRPAPFPAKRICHFGRQRFRRGARAPRRPAGNVRATAVVSGAARRSGPARPIEIAACAQ